MKKRKTDSDYDAYHAQDDQQRNQKVIIVSWVSNFFALSIFGSQLVLVATVVSKLPLDDYLKSLVSLPAAEEPIVFKFLFDVLLKSLVSFPGEKEEPLKGETMKFFV